MKSQEGQPTLDPNGPARNGECWRSLAASASPDRVFVTPLLQICEVKLGSRSKVERPGAARHQLICSRRVEHQRQPEAWLADLVPLAP